MAKFNAQGIEGLELSLEQFAQIPDDVVEAMLMAGGEVVVEAHKRSIEALGLVDTRKLKDSIKAHSKVTTKDGIRQRSVLVYPTGKRGTRNRKKVTKTYKRSKSGRTYTVGGDTVDVTNNEVGFVHEFGAPSRGIPAKQWMRTANEASADATTAAEFEVYDKWAKSLNL
ncbi:MAG: hypothetical protein IJX52_03310 [Oscillibacter sp.]|nr:hypothetical protein [Oscillibacter sp.]